MRENQMFEVNAYYFDWDQTLTTDHVQEWGQKGAPNSEKCKRLLKTGVIDKLREILVAGHHVAIVTNGTSYRIPWILKGAGMDDDEIANITIRAAENPDTVVRGFKPQAISDLAFGTWKEAKNHYFYDDRSNFCGEVQAIIPKFAQHNKTLTVTQVNPDDHSFLETIIIASPLASLKAAVLNALKIFLGITAAPALDNKTDDKEISYYRNGAVLKHTGLRDLSTRHFTDLTLEHFFAVCKNKNTVNVANFFNCIGRDTEIKKLYSLGEKCRTKSSKENYETMLAYLKTLNSKTMSNTEVLGRYFSYK